MASEGTSIPAGGIFTEEATPPGTGEITPAGKNPDKPGIAAMGGYAPNFPGEQGSRDTTFIEPRTMADEPVLDETDREYLGLDDEEVDIVEIVEVVELESDNR